MPNPFLGPAPVAWAPRAGPNVPWLLAPQNLVFPWFFQCFRVLGLLGPMLAQHGLQDASKSLQEASKIAQDASKTPNPVGWAPRAGQNIAWLLATKNIIFLLCVQCFRVLDILGLIFCSTWPPRRVQQPPRCLQDGPECLQDASKTAQDAHKTTQDASKTPRIASKTAQDASKTAPRETKKQ